MKKGINNLKYLKAYRKGLRNNPTKAETMLWKALRKNQLEGRKFRRQHSISSYILDFYCPKEKLAVEVDGEFHYNMVNEQYDHKRKWFLENCGIQLLRFENKQIFENLDIVLEAIKDKFRTK
ncbi:MAG: DUF559 domain-containing protein [Bacteroidota bacterium]